ncbi:MAG TPA: copper-binding protein [Candidatus Nitrosotalea sp.]|nr:copper-binding protein [Nitrososphaerota archaeon]HKU32342.1 copper-binding protein [Candidatus Nitrosotalea sp.]
MSVSVSHAYGIGLIAVIVGAAIGIGYYQLYYIPEYNAKPIIPEKVLNPGQTTKISIIAGSVNQDQQQNFVPKKQEVQLGVDNVVVWTNQDQAAHYVTPVTAYKDSYSGDFGSDAILPDKTYQFVFTQEAKIPYYCKVHPWMKGEIDIVHGALTS